MERQKRGPELHLTELQKADARGLALLQEPGLHLFSSFWLITVRFQLTDTD